MLVMLLGLAGPLLAAPRRFAIPVAVGEILAGVLFGASGLHIIDTSSQNLTLLSQIGFALVMMVTASHINLRKVFTVSLIAIALRNAGLVAIAATAIAYLAAVATGQQFNFATLAVIMASSSAAVVLPSFSGVPQSVANAGLFFSQVAVSDLLAIIVLPLVAGSANTGRVAIGAAVISITAVVIYFLLRWAQTSGDWKRMRKFSALHGFGLELRLSFILLLALIVLAKSFAVTIMIAGFGLGLAIAANGLPHRLAKQLFAVSEGFFSPVFFVLLGAGINVSAVFASSNLLLMALMLGFGSIVAHLVPMLFGMPLSFAVASSAQLGVPAAAVSIGLATHTLDAGQSAAIMLGAIITLAATAIAAAAKKSGSVSG